jgi:group I intron endonuclease
LKNKISGIYKIENIINKKVYIGQSNDIINRFKSHKNKLNNNKHPNAHLQNAWNKYEINNFKFEIIEECVKEIIDEREKFWINYYDSDNEDKGYNLESGGNKNKIVAEETKQKISSSVKKVYLSEEYREKHRKKIIGKKKGQLSEETKLKLSLANKGKHPSEESRRKMSESQKKRNLYYKQKGEHVRKYKKKYNKLSDDIIDEIRKKYLTGKYTQTELGKEYSITQQTVSKIVNYKGCIIYSKEFSNGA